MWSSLQLSIVLAGPFVGSFVAATADRMIAGVPVLSPRSRCDACGRVLRVRDLVPILSWLALRGRCRDCAGRIPLRVWLAEVAGAVLGAASALAAPGWLALASALLGWALLWLALLDLGAMWLPRVGGWCLAAAGLGVGALIGPDVLRAAAIGAGVGWALLAGIGWLFVRMRGIDGIGEGDPPLLSAAGAWVGWHGLPSVVLIAACTGIAHGVLGRHGDGAAGPVRVPFGAHLALATFVVWLAGPIG